MKNIGLILLGVLGIYLLGKAKAAPVVEAEELPVSEDKEISFIEDKQEYYLAVWLNTYSGQEEFGFFNNAQEAQDQLTGPSAAALSNVRFLGYVPTDYNPLADLYGTYHPFYHHESQGTIKTGDLPTDEDPAFRMKYYGLIAV